MSRLADIVERKGSVLPITFNDGVREHRECMTGIVIVLCVKLNS